MNDMSENIKNHGYIPTPFVRRDGRGINDRLAVIACCAGYGKTAYLAQLYGDIPGSVFLSLSGYDNSEERISALIEDEVSDLTGCVSVYDEICRFIGEISRRENALVLIDNADAVTDKTASALLDVLCTAALSGRFRLILAGREIPGFALRYVMDRRAGLYGIREMSFTRAETAEYLRLCGKDHTDKYLNTLYSFTGGWCIGVTTVVNAAGSDEDITECVFRTLLNRYTEYNILSGIEDELSDYLKLTAFIEPQDRDFSSAVFRINDGAARVDRLVTKGILSRDSDGITVFPEILRTILSAMLPAERKKVIMERASGYFIREKRFAEAIKLFDASGNAAAAERILKSYGESFLKNYEFELIGYCGDIIEKNRGSSDPEVLGILAQYYYYRGELNKMESAYNMADSMFGKENRYSVYRRLYNGLIRYEGNRELYTYNVKSAREYLEANSLPMPFLHQRELDTLALITGDNDDSGKLHIYRFGTLRLSVGDNEIQCKSRKSAELIAYMLENGGRPIPREKLLNMLWPGGIPQNAVAMLHNIIYGLRKELTAYGLENVIVYKNKCYMPDMSMIAEDDLEIFEICKGAEAADKKRLAAHEGTIEKYWGRYLGSNDSRGSHEQREYYDKCFVNASLIAAEIHREKGEYERELLFLKNASEIDPYSEQIVCAYITCCFAMGKPDKAKKKFEEYSVMIDEELGILPSKWLKNEFLAGFAANTEE